MGGKCVFCGETDEDKLEFDHKDPSDRDWVAKETELSWRISIYRREAKEDKLQLACKQCNTRKGSNQAYAGSPDDPDWGVD